jgi:hypothetical protein
VRFSAVVLFALVAGIFGAPIAVAPEAEELVAREASPEPVPDPDPKCTGYGNTCNSTLLRQGISDSMMSI